MNPRRPIQAYAVIAGSCFIAYLPIITNGFVNLDDPYYLLDHAGWSRKGWSLLHYFFFENQAGNWHPVTMMDLYVERWLFGTNPTLHHFSSLCWHIANSCLFFQLMAHWRRDVWVLLLTLLWCLHPVHVESVAWLAERKNLLSTFFMLLAVLSWLRFTSTHSRKSYALSWVLFVLAAASKAMVVTTPFILLLLELVHASGIEVWQKLKKTLVQLLPFFAVSFTVSLTTYLLQEHVDAVVSSSLRDRLLFVLTNYGIYTSQILYPFPLTVFYPASQSGAWVLVSTGLLLAASSAWALLKLFKHPWLSVGWLWFLGTLVPVVGFVQAGHQQHADRYLYLPLMGFVMMGMSLNKPSKNLQTLLVFIACVLGLLTHFQAKVWRNTETLYQHALNHTKDNWPIHLYSANYWLGKGQVNRSLRHLNEVLRLQPRQSRALILKAHIYADLNRTKDAENVLTSVLKDHHDHAEAWYLKAWLAWQDDRIDEAIAASERAVELSPRDPEAWILRARVFKELYDPKVVTCLKRAIDLNDQSRIRFELAEWYRAIGEQDLADREYERAQQQARWESWPGLTGLWL